MVVGEKKTKKEKKRYCCRLAVQQPRAKLRQQKVALAITAPAPLAASTNSFVRSLGTGQSAPARFHVFPDPDAGRNSIYF